MGLAKAAAGYSTKIFRGGKAVEQLMLFAVLVVLIVFFSLMTSAFLSPDNLVNVLRQVSMTGIVAAGLTLVLLTGGIDLSVASIVALTGVVTGLMISAVGLPAPVAILVGLTAATLIGMINGLIVTKVGIPSLITTLGMLTIVRGLAFVITGGYPVFGFSATIQWFGTGSVFGLPVPVILMTLVFVLVWILLYRTYIGRYIYALGGNPEAARLSGINIHRFRLFVFMASGFFAGLAGIILLGRLNSGQPNAVQGFELEVITAVVLGGVSIAGGRGRLMGVLMGVLIIGVLSNGLIIMGVDNFYQQIIKGSVLLLAVGIDSAFRRKGSSRGESVA